MRFRQTELFLARNWRLARSFLWFWYRNQRASDRVIGFCARCGSCRWHWGYLRLGRGYSWNTRAFRLAWQTDQWDRGLFAKMVFADRQRSGRRRLGAPQCCRWAQHLWSGSRVKWARGHAWFRPGWVRHVLVKKQWWVCSFGWGGAWPKAGCILSCWAHFRWFRSFAQGRRGGQVGCRAITEPRLLW